MKTKTLLFPILLCSLLLHFQKPYCQEANQILLRCQEKCISIDEGYYELTERWKPMTEKDTVSNSNTIYFSKAEIDDVFGMYFKSTTVYQDTARGVMLYDGKNLIHSSWVTKEATLRPVSRWKEDILQVKHNYRFYDPFASDAEDLPFPKTAEDEVVVSKEGNRNLDGRVLEHIKVHYKLDTDETEEMSVIYREQNFFIDPTDFIPYQYTERVDVIMAGDTMIQFKEYTIRNASFDKQLDQTMYSVTSLPADYTLKDYTPYKAKPLLEKNTEAPAWSFETLEGKMISLSDFKGKLVLLDFFYKSCYPCMLALPALQSLHEKYKDKGLIVIGMDPYDSKEDNLPEFLAKRNVTYQVVYTDRKFPDNYNVSGYPTIYLIDADGIIIHADTGYGDDTEASLEKIILKNLKKKSN